MSTRLVLPSPATLPGYVDALQRGWSPDTTRPDAAPQFLARVMEDASDLWVTVDDPQGLGPPVTLPDGQVVPRLPGLLRWIGDEQGFAGTINLRWMAGHAPLPPHVLGHMGYAVVPWMRRRGHATRAVGMMLDLARGHGLPFVELTTDADNVPSQRVITAHGGVLVEHFVKPAVYGGAPSVRYRIPLG